MNIESLSRLILILLLIGLPCAAQQSAKELCVIKEASDIANLFPQTIAELEQRTILSIESAEETLHAIIALSQDQRTYANTAVALDNLYLNADIAVMRNVLDIIQRVHPAKEFRDAAAIANKKIHDFYICNLDMNVSLYGAVQDYIKFNMDQESITPQEQYALQVIISRFRRSGIDLPPHVQDKIKKLKESLVPLMHQFEQNIMDDRRTISVDKHDLEGMSADFIASLKQIGHDCYELTLDNQTYHKIMTQCSCELTRKKAFLAWENRAYPQNDPILQEIAKIRDELAGTLGYSSYAQFDLADQMAKTPDNAKKFLQELLQKAMPKKAEEFKRFAADLPSSVTLTDDGKIRPWDTSYLSEFYVKKNKQYDPSTISEYFPLETTLAKILVIFEQFLGIELICITCPTLLDQEVKLIQMKQQHKTIGYILLDLYERPNKWAGGCHVSIIPSPQDGNGQRLPSLSCIVANMHKPSEGKPSLLHIQDLVIIFHELGHAMHALMGRTFINPFEPMIIQSDFLEVVSQLFQEWVWDRDILKRLSNHYCTHETLPDGFIDKILKKEFSSADQILWLIHFSLFSLDLYKKGGELDPHKLFYDLDMHINVHTKISKKGHYYLSISHWLTYGARGYSYLWAQVYALDIFYQIKKQGLLNQEMGKRLIRDVLSKGDNEDPNTFLKEFLGRDVCLEPFLDRMGLAEPA